MNLTVSRKKPTAVSKRSPHAAPDTLRSQRLTLHLPCRLNTVYSLHRCDTLYSQRRLNAGFSLYRFNTLYSPCRLNTVYSLHRCNTLYSPSGLTPEFPHINTGFSLYRSTHCNSALRCNALLRVRNNIFRFARAISPHQKRLFPFPFPRVPPQLVSYPAGQQYRPHFRQPLSRAQCAFLPFRPPQP